MARQGFYPVAQAAFKYEFFLSPPPKSLELTMPGPCSLFGLCAYQDTCSRLIAFPQHSPGESWAKMSARRHREPPQVKMTARMNSRPQSFTP